MQKKSIRELSGNLSGKAVFVRVDFNVPMFNGDVADDGRIRAALPTIKFLVAEGARVVLASHLGRPKKVDPVFTLAPVAKRLGELIGKPIKMAEDCTGELVRRDVASLAPGQILLLENVRFHPEEEANDPEFARELAQGMDIMVQDAFGTSHRAHASTVGVSTIGGLPAYAGFLVENELVFLGTALSATKRPMVAIIGGAKITGKIDVIRSLLPKVDTLLIGGGMAYTFLRSQGKAIGKSLCEYDKLGLASELLNEAAGKIKLPTDFVVTDLIDFSNRQVGNLAPVTEIADDMMSVDIGPESAKAYQSIVANAGTVVWNGPMGVFEISGCENGTRAVANGLVEATTKGAITIVGGGDSAAAIAQFGLADRVSHVSTGGGASLEFLEGKQLPGVAMLQDK